MSKKKAKLKANLPVVQKHDTLLKHISVTKLGTKYNPVQKHSAEQIKLIAKSIKDHGFTNPILCDPELNIITGHARIEAAKTIGMKEVPVRILRGLSEKNIRALIIRDNQLAQMGEWDYDFLKEEFHLIEDEFDIKDFGFENHQIDKIYNNLDAELERSSIPDEQELHEEDIQNITPVSQEGDVWLIGKHRVLCGSCLDHDLVNRFIGNDEIGMIITDAPYNVKTSGHIRVESNHQDFKMAAGEMSQEEFTEFLHDAFSAAKERYKNGALFFGFMDWRHMQEMMDACKETFGSQKQLIVWAKNNGGMGTFYRSQHELIFVYKYGEGKHTNNFGLGEHGRYRTNVWEYDGVNTFKKGRAEELDMHPTVKPVQMIEDAILDCSNRGEYIYDPFLGSGTAMVAAQNQGRICLGIEIDPTHVDTSIGRMERVFGMHAVHVETGLTFEETKQQLLDKENNNG